MGGGNAQKSATARARKMEKMQSSSKGSQLKSNEAAKTIKCTVCMQQFMSTQSKGQLEQHSENKHPKKTFAECFPDFAQ